MYTVVANCLICFTMFIPNRGSWFVWPLSQPQLKKHMMQNEYQGENKNQKRKIKHFTCAIHFSLMASLATASPQCNVRISNGTLGNPPAAGKNSSAVPLVGRLGCCCCYCHCYYLVFTCKGKNDVIHMHRYRSIKKKATQK
jgi:hypothetical protein